MFYACNTTLYCVHMRQNTKFVPYQKLCFFSRCTVYKYICLYIKVGAYLCTHCMSLIHISHITFHSLWFVNRDYQLQIIISTLLLRLLFFILVLFPHFLCVRYLVHSYTFTISFTFFLYLSSIFVLAYTYNNEWNSIGCGFYRSTYSIQHNCYLCVHACGKARENNV